MHLRLVGTVVTAGGAFLGLLSLPLAGQQASSSSSAPPLVITAYNGGPPIPYTVARTPWGEPDLQGTWSSDDATMPLNRPQGQTNLYLSEAEFEKRKQEIAAGVRRGEETAESSFRNDFARRAFRQTSLVVDPADGRV